jgi:hypothetical protein
MTVHEVTAQLQPAHRTHRCMHRARAATRAAAGTRQWRLFEFVGGAPNKRQGVAA